MSKKLENRPATKLSINKDHLRGYTYGKYGQWVWDTKVPGFAVRCYPKSKRRSFYVKAKQLIAPGQFKTRYIKLDDCPEEPRDADLPALRNRAKRYIKNLKVGIDPDEAVKQVSEDVPTLRRMIDLLGNMESQTRKDVDHVAEDTMKQIRMQMSCFSEDWLDLPMESITRRMIADRAMVIKGGNFVSLNPRNKSTRPVGTRRTVNRWLSYARTVWFRTTDFHDLELNPFQLVLKQHGIPTKTDREEKIESEGGDHIAHPTDSEVREIFDAGFDGVYAIYARMAQLQLLVGTRAKEIAGLRWDNIRTKDIYLKADQTKSGRTHTIPLTPHITAILGAQRELDPMGQSKFVFPSTATGEARTKPSEPATKLAGKLGHKWTSHDLRRCFTSTALKLNISDAIRRALLNHKMKDVHEDYERSTYWKLQLEALQLTQDRLKSLGR